MKKVLTLKEQAQALVTANNMVFISEKNNAIHVVDSDEKAHELIATHDDLFDIKRNVPVVGTIEEKHDHE